MYKIAYKPKTRWSEKELNEMPARIKQKLDKLTNLLNRGRSNKILVTEVYYNKDLDSISIEFCREDSFFGFVWCKVNEKGEGWMQSKGEGGKGWYPETSHRFFWPNDLR